MSATPAPDEPYGLPPPRARGNLIGGSPRSTAGELSASVNVNARFVAASPKASFILNDFVVFPSTPVTQDPGRIGVTPGDGVGDMLAIQEHLVTGSEPGLNEPREARRDLLARIGLDGVADRRHGEKALGVSFGTGNSTVCTARSPESLARDGIRATEVEEER